MPTAQQKRNFAAGDLVKIAKKTHVVDKDDGVECDLTGEKVTVDGDPYESPTKGGEYHVPVKTHDGATLGIPLDRLERTTPTRQREDGYGGGGSGVSRDTLNFWKERFAKDLRAEIKQEIKEELGLGRSRGRKTSKRPKRKATSHRK